MGLTTSFIFIEHVTSTSMLAGIWLCCRRLERLERKPSRAVLRRCRHASLPSFTRLGAERIAKPSRLVDSNSKTLFYGLHDKGKGPKVLARQVISRRPA